MADWKPTNEKQKYGVAVYNFHGKNILFGLTLRIGETVQILEECQSWFKGCSFKEPLKRGIFPKNCIALKDARVTRNGPYEIVEPIREAVIEEVTGVLREWSSIMKDLFLERKQSVFSFLKENMLILMDLRREVIFGNLATEQLEDLKESITQKIDLVNSKLKLDLVPRVDGEVVDGDSASVVELYKIHLSSSEKTSGPGSDPNSKNTLQLQKHKFKTLTKHTTLRRHADRKNTTQHHLFLAFKSFLCNIGEPALLLFSLYDALTNTYISERFMVRLTKHGVPSNIELFLKQFGIFTDLTSNDLMRDVHLVCKIFREGKLKEDSKKPSNAEYRRPFGAGVTNITSLLIKDDDLEREIYMDLYNCNENDFHNLEDLIIRKQTGKYNSFGSNKYSVCVDLKLYHGDPEKVIQEKGSCALTPRIGFPEVILPGYVRNDFYMTICRAEFEKGSKSSAKNVEVALCIVSDKGQVFNDCMYIGSGDKPVSEYRSYVLYHSNSPQWNETIKISLPIDKFHTAHLRFTFSHCSRNQGKMKGEKVFGFSFVKLQKDDGTILHDDTYTVFIYKMDNSVNFASVNSYLRLPSNQVEKTKQEASGALFAGPAYNPKESFTLRTFLCSTKLTQNTNIVKLLRWRGMEKEEIIAALNSLLKVSPDEVIKFIQDIFDALFNILSEKDEQFSLPVFKALVSISKLVEEKAYLLFKSTLNTYINEHFSSTLAYGPLINSFCYTVAHPNHQNLKWTLKDAAKSFKFLVKMILKSFHLSNANQNGVNDFKDMLKKMFKTLTKVMESTNEYLIECKVEFLRRLPLLCEDIFLVLNEQEFSLCIQELINSVPKVSSPSVHVEKMRCLQNLVDTRLFKDSSGRKVLLPVLVTNLKYLLEKKQNLVTCLDVLGEVITGLYHLPIQDVRDDINILSTTMLDVIVNVRLTMGRNGHMNGLSVSCLLGVLRLMEESHYHQYLQSFDNKVDLRDFINKLTLAFKEMLTIELFPKDWFVLKTVGNYIILTAVQYFSKAFTDYFLENDFFDIQLWENYFRLAVLFMVQPSLALETFSQSKRDKVQDRYGDMRQIMGFEIIEMWGVLGDHKKSFIPSLIGPFLEMMLLPEQELRRATIPIFYDMMKVDFAEHHTFQKVESELIVKLEMLMNESKGDLEFQELFQQIMTEKFAECPDPQLHQQGLKSVQSLTDLLKRLLDYRAAASDMSNYQQNMICINRLLEFYSELSRKDMYINCVYKLVKLHNICDNYSEAGFTLLLHADLLHWSDEQLPAILKFPIQLEWERKEQLYLEIIDYLDKGKIWEKGIDLCKELGHQYEERLDYKKLSNILRKQAYFYDNIMTEVRSSVTYFRVSFYGRGFPHYLKDQVFIYRGFELDNLAAFTSRVKNQFPSAEIMSKNTPPDNSIVQGIGQHIQICNVEPIPDEISIFNKKNVDEKILSYYRFNDVGQFVFRRPFHKGQKDPNNEFKTLWLEQTMHWSKTKLPNVLKWSPVESIRKSELTPLENALEMIVSKNREISKLVEEFRVNPPASVSPLSMVLNGVIDANVNGGIAKYQDAFLAEEYLFFNPEEKDNVDLLKKTLQEQVNILEDGLKVHEKVAEESMRPFHEQMIVRFSAMKTSIETGQPMESVMSRPTSIQLNSSTSSIGKPSPRHSPRDSPSVESRKGFLSPSGKAISEGDITVSRREKSSKSNFSTSLQNMFKRTSLTPEASVEIVTALQTHNEHSSVPHHKKSLPAALPSVAVPPPLPPRRISAHSIDLMDGESPIIEVSPNLSPAAMKRLGITSALASSATNLTKVDEEETPSLPPKRATMKKRSISLSSKDSGSSNPSSRPSSGHQHISGDSNPSSRPPSGHQQVPIMPTEYVNEVFANKPSPLHGLNTESDTKDVTTDNSNDFSEPAFADVDAELYDNLKDSQATEENEFYVSPKELVPNIYTPEKVPPKPRPRASIRSSKSLDDLTEAPIPPRRISKASISEDDPNAPPPLPKKSSRKTSQSET